MSDTPAVHRFAGDPFGFAASSSVSRTPGRADSRSIAGGSASRSTDRVELTEKAQYMSKMTSMPAIRKDLVEQIRREITSGNYDTSDKLDQAIANLSNELDLFA